MLVCQRQDFQPTEPVTNAVTVKSVFNTLDMQPRKQASENGKRMRLGDTLTIQVIGPLYEFAKKATQSGKIGARRTTPLVATGLWTFGVVRWSRGVSRIGMWRRAVSVTRIVIFCSLTCEHNRRPTQPCRKRVDRHNMRVRTP